MQTRNVYRYWPDHKNKEIRSLRIFENGWNKQGEYLLSKIQKDQVREFSRRDAMRLCRRIKTVEEMQPVLNRLCEYGYIAPKPTESVLGAGRKPSEVYLTNPMLLAS